MSLSTRSPITDRSGGVTVTSFVEVCSQTGPDPDVSEVSMEQVIREEMDVYQRQAWTVRIPDPTRSQVCEVYTWEESDEWWVYQRKIGKVKCHVRIIHGSSENCIQYNRDIVDVLRNVSERLFHNFQSPDPVTDLELISPPLYLDLWEREEMSNGTREDTTMIVQIEEVKSVIRTIPPPVQSSCWMRSTCCQKSY